MIDEFGNTFANVKDGYAVTDEQRRAAGMLGPHGKPVEDNSCKLPLGLGPHTGWSCDSLRTGPQYC